MSARLAAALVERVRRIDAQAKFLVMEAVSEELAHELSRRWDDDDRELPVLAIANSQPQAFGRHGLHQASAATLRNSHAEGVCVVICEGAELAERQSINDFMTVSPSDLLEDKNRLMLLGEALVPVRRDGPVAAVREALVTLPRGLRPNALAVAQYFDLIAEGSNPLVHLPAIGGFRDDSELPDVTGERVRENLMLAARRHGEEVIRSEDYALIRRRAERLLDRRPGESTSDGFMQLLENGSDEILTYVTYDEAREILTTVKKGLAQEVREALTHYRTQVRSEDSERAALIPWDAYQEDARRLDRSEEQRFAAESLLGFDETENGLVFEPPLRNRLRALLRDKVVNATPGSCPEVGLARAIRSLGSPVSDIEVLSPALDGDPTTAKQSRDWVSLAVCRMRLTSVFSELATSGCQVDQELVGEVLAGADSAEARQHLIDANLTGAELPPVRVRVSSAEQSVELAWAPDGDDAALLRSVLEFAESPAVSLTIVGNPDARPFASCDEPGRRPPSDGLRPLANRLSELAQDVLRDGLRPQRLRHWCDEWSQTVQDGQAFGGGRGAEELNLLGCVEGRATGGERALGMGCLAPVKAEWLADYLATSRQLISEALEPVDEDGQGAAAFEVACQALRDVTSAHCPAFLRTLDSDTPLLPSKESRSWSVYGGNPGLLNFERHAMMSIDRVVRRLIRLQPEAAGHFRCLAIGPGSGALMLSEAIEIVGRIVEGVRVGIVELFVVGSDVSKDSAYVDALARADEATAALEAGEIRLRHFDSLDDARLHLGGGRKSIHFALFTGLTDEDHMPQVDHVEFGFGAPDDGVEVLFSPRVALRPDKESRVVLSAPTPSKVGASWLRVAQTIDDDWPDDETSLVAPEIRVRATGSRDELRVLHGLSLWVATVDRYATRDSLERALGDEVAILHQERRLGSESPIGLVVSQEAGGPVDRAIGRSLRSARIVSDANRAESIGTELRKVAAQGYGVLALEAATSGTGINELVGHVVGFSMLATEATPWPLPPDCRLLLVSLDEHAEWFLGQKRADLLALAIDVPSNGLHAAVIEVKARRTDTQRAEAEALDQLRRTLIATAPAAQPDRTSIASRIWLNRIAEALYSAARESRIRLSSEELQTIEGFRAGRGTLEWAGLGLVFGPDLQEGRRVLRQAIGGDQIPMALRTVRLTQQRLEEAIETNLRNLRTAEPIDSPLGGGRVRRRPESGVARPPRPIDGAGGEPSEETQDQDGEAERESGEVAEESRPNDVAGSPFGGGHGQSSEGEDEPREILLGHDLYAGNAAIWKVSGEGALSNGHVQIWGSSGAGKTQFIKMLLAQISAAHGANFGIADFKNDYGSTGTEDFPASVGAEFIDLWGQPGAPYNPLALTDADDRNTRIIEFRDSIEQAMAAYQRIGARQKRAIEVALRSAYEAVRAEGRWPTMLDLSHHLTDDIEHILGDLTRYEIFSDGPSLSTVVNRNVVFGLNRIPGNGQTTTLAAAFLLATISLTIQDLPPVANTIRYALVVDEAHRVARFRAVDLMIKEGRSKGLAVVLATQSPSDLPETVDTNAQTRICFRLSDAMVATQAARKLDPNDSTLPDRIRTLGNGEAFVSLQGRTPVLLRMLQHYRDRSAFDRGDLGRQET